MVKLQKIWLAVGMVSECNAKWWVWILVLDRPYVFPWKFSWRNGDSWKAGKM